MIPLAPQTPQTPQTFEQILVTLSERMNILSQEIRILNEGREETVRRAHRRWRIAAFILGVVLFVCVVGIIFIFADGHAMLICGNNSQ